MKIFGPLIVILNDRVKPFGILPDWHGKLQNAGVSFANSLQRIKSIGFTVDMDDYEKRKLGIFNQLNFFQLVTWVVIPVIGALSNRHFPLSAWMIAYFVLYPLFTSIVYAWGINMGVELFFILYGILSVFFIQEISQMLFALGLSMVSYFVLAVVCKNYTYQL